VLALSALSGIRQPIFGSRFRLATTDIGGQCSQFTGKADDFGELDKQLKRQIKKTLRLMCRDIKLGVAAAQLAIADAGLVEGNYEPARTGTVFGSDYIMLTKAAVLILKSGPKKVCRLSSRFGC